MRIGLISKPDHCKNHVKSLTEEGYDLVVLGGSPVSVPPSVDVLVLRTDSCSHGASDTALAWARSTGLPLIVHNGLTSIRRELRRIAPMEAPAIDFAKALKVLMRDRPSDSPALLKETLTLMGASPQDLEPLFPPPPSGDWGITFPKGTPGGFAWEKALPLPRLLREFEATRDIYNQTPQATRDLVRDTFVAYLMWIGETPASPLPNLNGRAFPFFYADNNPLVPQLRGKPIRFLLFLIRTLPENIHPSRVSLNAAYLSFCDKDTDQRVADGVAWALGRTLGRATRHFRMETEVEAPPEPVVEDSGPFLKLEPGQFVVESSAENANTWQEPSPEWSNSIDLTPGIDQRVVEILSKELAKLRVEFEEHILDLMNSVALLKKENQALSTSIQTLSKSLPSEKAPDTVLSLIDQLKSRGAKVTIEI